MEKEMLNIELAPKQLSDAQIAAMKSAPSIEGFRSVDFFRNVKEKMAKATEGMTLQEKRQYWKLLRDDKIKLELGYDLSEEVHSIAAEEPFVYKTKS